MQGGYFSYGLLAALAIALVIAAVTDFRRRQIDNWLNGGIVLGAPLFWYSSGLSLSDIGWQLGVAVFTFAVLAVLFALRAMGGGDVKLLTALALWIKPAWFLELVVYMSLLGGLLTIIFGAWHLTRRRKDKVMIPYGIAISTAGLWVMGAHYLPAFQAGVQAG
jgi:prepilin peptidase CpaA